MSDKSALSQNMQKHQTRAMNKKILDEITNMQATVLLTKSRVEPQTQSSVSGSKVAQKRSRSKMNEGAKTIRRRKTKFTLSEKINLESPANEYVLDEVVFATIPGFCLWPARIVNIAGETITVEFFGTGHM